MKYDYMLYIRLKFAISYPDCKANARITKIKIENAPRIAKGLCENTLEDESESPKLAHIPWKYFCNDV